MKHNKNKAKKDWIVGLMVLFLLFLLFLSILFPFIVFVNSNEFYDLDEVIKLQRENTEELLFGPAYSDPVQYYKLLSASYKPVEVLVMGTSRSIRFRSQFFNTSFYNSGRGISIIGHLSLFLDGIPEDKQPTLILLGLDQNFFNLAWDKGIGMEDYVIEKPNKWSIFQENIINVLEDFFIHRKIDYSNILGRDTKNIGLNAVMNGNGFRNDGSYYEEKTFLEGGVDNPEYKDFEFKYTMELIDKGILRYEPGENISQHSLVELHNFLSKAKERNITVIGFLHPYAHKVWQRINEKNDDYKYIFKLNKTLGKLFSNFDYSFYDFSDPNIIGADACEVYDGLHLSEKAYVRLLLKMAETSREIEKRIDRNYLESNLRKSDSCFLVFS